MSYDGRAKRLILPMGRPQCIQLFYRLHESNGDAELTLLDEHNALWRRRLPFRDEQSLLTPLQRFLQRQHIELTRDIARRFHALYGDAFTLPEGLVPERGARIMGLDDPTVKMSKSLAESRRGHAIGLTDPPDAIRAAVMGAVTDSGQALGFDRLSPGLENLATIYEALSDRSRADIEREFSGH